LWLEELGLKETEALLAANNKTPPVTLRVNSLKTSKQEVASWLNQNNVPFSFGKFFSEALILKSGQLPEELINQGLVYVQDEASMAVAHVLEPQPGETVIDLASGPGGKTTHLAALKKNKGIIYAVEINKNRLNLVRQNCHRLGVINVKYIHGDAALPLKLPLSEKVLVDAPCSGLGVLARRPDLRWRKSLNDIERLAKLQKAILARAATYVKKQGTLVYAACTISKKETVEVVEQFLKTHPEFNPVKPQLNTVSAELNSWLQFMPHKHGTDGFFIAKLKKV
jgi:16S rRNA (cytosine967-C5)-methyltransferase